MRRVVIIGAGPCGLAALKEMLQGGHEAILLERSATLGGVFATGAIYPNLHLTISNWAMAYSDFPDPERLCYPSAERYLSYLQSYARHFDLERHIRYHSEVCSATLDDDGLWSLQVRQLEKQSTLRMQAEALIVATGANQEKNEMPSELAGFGGRVLHSSEYDEEFKNEVAKNKLRVLVVGGGESGADISAELGDLSPNVTVRLRRAPCIGPRYLNSKDEMQQVASNKVHDFPANGFLEAATTNRMSGGQNVYAFGLLRQILWNAPVLNSTLSRICLSSTTCAPVMNDQAILVTKNQRMCEALHDKKIEALICPTVSAYEQTCEFHMPDGTKQQREYDAIVLCNGFHTEYPWLKINDFDRNPRTWFLHCFPEGLGHCLFFVGNARPHQGGIPAMAEILSRYISLVLRGERVLPSNYALQARSDGAAEREYYHLSPNLHTLVDYNAFLERVARYVGCEPRLPASCIVVFNLHILAVLLIVLGCFSRSLNPLGFRSAMLLWASTAACFLLIDNGLLIKWWFYPNWATWYRQRGPDANPKHIDDIMRRVNLWTSTSITLGFVLLVSWSVPNFYAQRLLSVFLFVPYTILTAFDVRFRKAWGGLLRPKIFALHHAQWRFSDLFMP